MNYFQHISFQDLYNLIWFSTNLEMNTYDYIKNVYREKSTHFDENLDFLCKVNLLCVNRNRITFNKKFGRFKKKKSLNENEIKEAIIEQISTNKRFFNSHIKPFLIHFNLIENDIIFELIGRNLTRFSAIRDFLVDLEIVDFEKSTRICRFNNRFTYLFEFATRRKSLSPNHLKKIRDKQEKLSSQAEKFVFEIEKSKFSSNVKLQKKIELTAAYNINAGYDIKSFEIVGGVIEDKFIEVKSVSKNDYRFFFTKNEMRIAKLKKNEYHLFLLPVLENCKFDIENAIVIRNPMKYLYNENNNWPREIEVVSFHFDKNE